MISITPAPEFAERLQGEANGVLDATFERLVQSRSAARAAPPAGQRFTEALLRTASWDEEFKNGFMKDARSPREQLQALRDQERFNQSVVLRESPSARAWSTRPPRVMDSPRVLGAEDSHLQILGPPYAGRWTSSRQSGNAQVQNLAANEQTGEFGYFMGSADGAAWCGAGVWVQFVPSKNTRAQVRPYTPYDSQYDLDSQYGYTAHGHGGFGLLVVSWSANGTGPSTDLDYRYTDWSDGTGWWEQHDNPSFPDHDFGYAYLYGKEAPYFEVRANRVYLACIWGFGGSDSGGGYFGNALSASALNAAARFVVIGEQ